MKVELRMETAFFNLESIEVEKTMPVLRGSEMPVPLAAAGELGQR